MKYLTVIFFFAILCSSCKRPKIGLLNTNNLPSSFITVDAGKDYHLKTFKGAVVKIAANSFDVPTGTQVKIEMKEAYVMQDIMAAGLTTRSNGKLLESGGMLYFNATADGEVVKFLKPVSITTPAKVYNQNMQLFKGEAGEDSSINWVNPVPFDTTLLTKNLSVGEALFKTNCANCHKPLDQSTGPALAGARNREPSKDWVYKFVNNLNAMYESDIYARLLLEKYGSRMTQFNLPEQDIKNILDYCDNEAALYKPELLNGEPFPNAIEAEGAFTDCGFDTVPVPVMDATMQPFMEDTLLDETNDFTNTGDASSYTIPSKPGYSFSIEACGWYNIDCFMDTYASLIKDAELLATLSGVFTENANVYLCIPSRNLLTIGEVDKEGAYVFYQKDIKLIMGDHAFVFAVCRDDNYISFGSSSFKVKSSQQIDIDVKISSQEKILDAFKRNNLDGVRIDINKKKIELILPEVSPLPTNNNLTVPVNTPVLPDTTGNKVEWQIIKKDCNSMFKNAGISDYLKPKRFL